MAEVKKDSPKTRSQVLTEQYLFRGKVYGPGEGKKAARVDVPEDFPTEDELKERAEKARLGSLGGPSSPLSISARSAKAAKAMLEEGEDVSGEEGDEDEEVDEEPVALDAKGEPLYADDSEGDGSLDESMASEGGDKLAKRRGARKKVVKKGRK